MITPVWLPSVVATTDGAGTTWSRRARRIAPLAILDSAATEDQEE